MKDGDIKAAMEPGFRREAEARAIEKEAMIAKLPGLRAAKKAAEARGDAAEAGRIGEEYQALLDVLAKP